MSDSEANSFLTRLRDHPVTALMLLSAVMVTLAWWIDGSVLWIDTIQMDIRALHGEPWRLITSALPHVDLLHLAFNVTTLWMLSSFIERELGSWATLLLIIILAAISAAAEYAVLRGGVGLSGIGYGMFGLLWVLNHLHPKYRGKMDPSLPPIFVGWFILCCVLTATYIWPVANIAHAAGAVAGGLLGLAMTPTVALRRIAIALLLLITASCYLGTTTFRSTINLGGTVAHDLAFLGYWQLNQNKNEDAANHFAQAIELEDHHAPWWFNRGIALHRLNRTEQAAKAYQQAARLNKTNKDYLDQAASMTAHFAYERQEAAAYEEAVMLYRAALDFDDRLAYCWYNLGTALEATGKFNAAGDAYHKAAMLDPEDKGYQAATLRLPPNKPR